MTGIYRTLRTARVSLDQIFSILDTQEHIGDAPDAGEVTDVQGEVEFDGVHFTYGATGTYILRASICRCVPAKWWPSSVRAAPAKAP